jgi:hypothetical protein
MQVQAEVDEEQALVTLILALSEKPTYEGIWREHCAIYGSFVLGAKNLLIAPQEQ